MVTRPVLRRSPCEKPRGTGSAMVPSLGKCSSAGFPPGLKGSTPPRGPSLPTGLLLGTNHFHGSELSRDVKCPSLKMLTGSYLVPNYLVTRQNSCCTSCCQGPRWAGRLGAQSGEGRGKVRGTAKQNLWGPPILGTRRAGEFQLHAGLSSEFLNLLPGLPRQPWMMHRRNRAAQRDGHFSGSRKAPTCPLPLCSLPSHYGR